MTNYREILRLLSMGISNRDIAKSVPCSRNTVASVSERAREAGLSWPLPPDLTDRELEKLLYPKLSAASEESDRAKPDFEYMRRELQKNGVTKKLLWFEYLERCRQTGEKPLMYSHFCYLFQQDEMQHRATMHLTHKPGEQIEVDWAGDPATYIDPDTGEILKAFVFIGVLSYSHYAYVEAFPNEKQRSWITAHVHMFEYFGGAAKILIPDNCMTAVNHNKGWNSQEINSVYREMAEHYGTVVIPARVRKPKDKPTAEGTVGVISTWITAALRHSQFYSLEELNRAIHQKLQEFNDRPFTKRDGSRSTLFLEEKPYLLPLPAYRFEMPEVKEASVQYNYHVYYDTMFYSVPYNYIRKKVTIRATSTAVEIYSGSERIATHVRLHGKPGQYSTVPEHMPEKHQEYANWSGDYFRGKAAGIGPNTKKVVDALLISRPVEQQAYRSCKGLLMLAEKYSARRVEAACGLALSYTSRPSYKSVKNILATMADKGLIPPAQEPDANQYALTRGSDYYKGR